MKPHTESTTNIRKEWLNIDDVEDINKSEESRNSGWDELVIPHKFSRLLLSLVSNHISDIRVRQWEALANNDSTDQIDLVRGKGRGLIILLHGQFPISWRNLSIDYSPEFEVGLLRRGILLGNTKVWTFVQLSEGLGNTLELEYKCELR